MSILLTKQAALRVSNLLSQRGSGVGLRIKVKTTGCSGLSYKLEYVDKCSLEDLVFESFGVKIFIKKDHLIYLDGTEIDYAKEGFKEGFKFINPNEKARCGCGESFTI
ncbi:HesB/IscA family protein [Candidatus Kinetoplastidibacterium crithidiae]|uniref:Iron-sulfur cluster assembly protein n=1 Tax=Candidatus Kinetoplastidibacterium crithidiae TCC036E TaxID=1208918 RepID=M1LTV8_9PROT|nr:iron-sulfur cluster assembly accessory protein [Candidatus Kinetoplastibacterium crithidii]AFZ82806.1 iron-sulfur cluster assembly protein [Candidatus Kinetoplastibacterium crithidii (ex Angomonas deanei ATCC 30255)]AGF47541.1 iron-sulfur cluster assembly protein [Candidatus Kinetoplastibacterium crithidii TCC036E]